MHVGHACGSQRIFLGASSLLLSLFGEVLTFPLLCSDTLTKVTYRRRFILAFGSRGFQSLMVRTAQQQVVDMAQEDGHSLLETVSMNQKKGTSSDTWLLISKPTSSDILL